jgi:GST-like protein
MPANPRFYGAGDLVEFDKLRHVPGWLERCVARPAVQRGLNIPSWTPG